MSNSKDHYRRKLLKKKKQEHDELVNSILKNPELIGIDPSRVIYKEKEPMLWWNSKGYDTVDIIFLTQIDYGSVMSKYEIVAIECMRGTVGGAAIKQLKSAGEYFKKYWKEWIYEKTRQNDLNIILPAIFRHRNFIAYKDIYSFPAKIKKFFEYVTFLGKL
jgi:hypothetical protein